MVNPIRNREESHMAAENLDVMIGIDSALRYEKRSKLRLPYDLSQLVFETFETEHPPSRGDMRLKLNHPYSCDIDGNPWYDGYATHIAVPVDDTKTIRKDILRLQIGGKVIYPWQRIAIITLFYESKPTDGVYRGFISFDERDTSHSKVMNALNTLAEMFFD